MDLELPAPTPAVLNIRGVSTAEFVFRNSKKLPSHAPILVSTLWFRRGPIPDCLKTTIAPNVAHCPPMVVRTLHAPDGLGRKLTSERAARMAEERRRSARVTSPRRGGLNGSESSVSTEGCTVNGDNGADRCSERQRSRRPISLDYPLRVAHSPLSETLDYREQSISVAKQSSHTDYRSLVLTRITRGAWSTINSYYAT